MDNVGEEKWNLEVYDPDLNMLTRQHQLTLNIFEDNKNIKKGFVFCVINFPSFSHQRCEGTLIFSFIRDAGKHLTLFNTYYIK